ncbi:related to CAR1 - Arginase [Ustilago sp. UG-2017a]|nr:related to CAR1 - Arginase [Ustilago sp. UG-2017a]
MIIRKTLCLLLATIGAASAGHSHSHSPGLDEDHHGAWPHSSAEFPPTPLVEFPSNDIPDPWTTKYAGVAKPVYAGFNTYAHLPTAKCLNDPDQLFDVAILGIPYDLTVTYRPGARFGPNAIRQASRRQRAGRTFSLHHMQDPYATGLRFLDCDDIPTSGYDPALAIDQIEAAYTSLLQRSPASDPSLLSTAQPSAAVSPEAWAAFSTAPYATDAKPHPKIVSLGGDHTIVLPILRSLHRFYGPIAIQHGTFFWQASLEGLIARNQSIHAGIRTRLGSYDDIEHDSSIGFDIIISDDIDDLGIPTIISNIRERVGTMPVYLSIDIDTLDPGFAPGTGTLESAGWSPRELRRILRGLEGLNFVGFDLVEVSPAYDQAEITAYAASDLIYEFMNLLTRGNDMQAKGKVAEPKRKGKKKAKSKLGALLSHGDEL